MKKIIAVTKLKTESSLSQTSSINKSMDTVSRISFQEDWANYFLSYDKLLEFGPYKDLVFKEIPDVTIPYIHNHFKNNIKQTSEYRILDTGTGTGNVILGLQEVFQEKFTQDQNNNIQFVGIDVLDEALKIAQKKLKQNTKLFQGNLSQKKFGFDQNNLRLFHKNTPFQMIVMNNVFYCLKEEEKRQYLKSIKALLDKEEGVLIISEPTGPTTRWIRFKFILQHLRHYGFFKGLSILKRNKEHLNCITRINKKIITSKNYQYLNEKEFDKEMNQVGFTKTSPIQKAYGGLNRIYVYKRDDNLNKEKQNG